MPKTETRFCTKWLFKLDETNAPCSRWLKQGRTSANFFCIVCNEEKSCKNGGWSDVYKHSKRPKHLQRLKDVIESGQIILTNTHCTSNNSHHERILTYEEKITRAETFWALATAKHGLSYNSSQYISELFSQMFSDSTIAKEFSMKPRKLSYILSHGTGFYFTKLMLNDLIRAPGYTLIFDETITIRTKKQLDLYVRYWCEQKQEIVVRYYKSLFLGHSTAEIITRSIIDCLHADGIDLRKMLMLGRDNPNVNKTIEKLINQQIQNEYEKSSSLSKRTNHLGLISIGSCPLHLIHNSFKISLNHIQWSIEEFLHHLVVWFDYSPSRREDFHQFTRTHSTIQPKFIPHFSLIRWIEISSILERVIEQWTNFKEYFLQFIPQTKKCSMKKFPYENIRINFQQSLTLIRLHFLMFICQNIYRQILIWFQSKQPLIHLLFEEIQQLIQRLFRQFIRDDLTRNRTLDELIEIPFYCLENQKIDSNIEIGEATRYELENLSNNECQQFFLDVRSIYSRITDELIRTLPLKNSLLRHLQCLHPSMRHSETSYTSIMNLVRSFPQMNVPDDIDRLSAEWIIYQNEQIPNEWFENNQSIDYYWREIFKLKTNHGTNKFHSLTRLVKCALALSHGNADIERGFSENAFLVSDDRSLLSDASINGLRATRDAVKFFGNDKAHEVPISKDLLECVRNAHSKYCQDLDKHRQQIEIKQKFDEQQENEKNLYDEQISLHKDLANIQRLLDEGTERLAKALASKDFKEIETAQLLLEGGNKKLAQTNIQIVHNNHQLDQLRKKQKK